jgi:uncharacterized membrane protein
VVFPKYRSKVDTVMAFVARINRIIIYIYMIILYSPIAKVIYHNSVIRVKGYSGYNCT